MRVSGDRRRSLVDVLHDRADAKADARAYTFLDDGESEGRSLTWGALDQRARAIGAAVAERVGRGARVLVMFPPGLEFLPAFFGTLCAGAIAVPTYPPSGRRGDRTGARLRGMIADAGISLIVAPAELRTRASVLASLVPELRELAWLAPEEVAGAPFRGGERRCSDADVALLQYTSGSTTSPRGVMVSHGNLLHNLAHSARLAAHTDDSVAVSWLPVNHDMGLIDGLLQPAYSGFPAFLMAPAAFLQRPARWLEAVSRVRGTHSGGPNFAYDLCVRRVSAEDRASLDLRCWRIAFNGSEPIRYSTLEAFQRAFGECGFRFSAFRPAYGLAESTLLVTAAAEDEDPEPLTVDAGWLARGRVATTAVGSPGSATVVSSGSLDGISRVLIVDPVTRRQLDPDRVGEIWVAGGSVARGYWQRPEETDATFQARLADGSEAAFLRTGDLGFVRGGRLFVTGRIKDVLIIRGLKHYPQDLEQTAERSHAALRPGGCTAVAVPVGEGEGAAVIAEIDPRSAAATGAPGPVSGEILTAIRRSIAEVHHVSLAAVALVPAGSLPKTTSGKLQRYLCREAFVARTLPVIDQWQDEPDLLVRAAS
ncbi:MAG TPA: fatty acyl-AMP ligase [Vicinamibacterales bacterium]|nr:fatty acyl-AMP ligase [Vicinamibacterales bacterium]